MKMGSLLSREESAILHNSNRKADPSLSSKHVAHCVTKVPSELPFKLFVNDRPITDDYLFTTKVLGSGFNGPVCLVAHRVTGRKYAAKCYRKLGASEEQLEYLKSEAEVYSRLDHPNVAKLVSIYEDEGVLWMIMEYCGGPELYEHLEHQYSYREQDAAYVASQMLEAVHYLHSNNIVHRDLKLENWLYEADEESSRLKLIDFGFSKIWNPTKSQKMHASCGSLSYMSPDTLSGSYTNACDMWSFGVIVYMLLAGTPPFYGSSNYEVTQKIKSGDYSMHGKRWKRISALAKDFVSKLLLVNPLERMTAKEASEHLWVAQRVKLPESIIDGDVLRRMHRFAMSTRLRRVALTMIACYLSSHEIRGLVEQFLKFDKTRNGSISVSDFAEVMNQNCSVSHEEIKALFSNIMMTSTHSNEDFDEEELSIHYTDFVASMLEIRLHYDEGLIRQAFSQFDLDRNGYITVENLKEILGKSSEGETVEAIVAMADKNGDNRIDYQEFLDVLVNENNLENESSRRFDSLKEQSKEAPSSSNGDTLGGSSYFFDQFEKDALHESKV